MGKSGEKKVLNVWWSLPYFQFLEDKHTPKITVPSMTQEQWNPFANGFTAQGSRSDSGISKRGSERRQVDDNIMKICFNGVQQEPGLISNEHSVKGENVAI